MRRMTLYVTTLAMGVLMLVGIQAPSFAEQVKTKCTDNNSTCMQIFWSNLAGTNGVHIRAIWLECDPNIWAHGWDHPADDGTYIHIHKGQPGNWQMPPEMQWDDAHSNVDTSDGGGSCLREIYIDRTWNTTDMLVEWDFIEQRNLAVDYEHILTATLSS